MIVNFLRARCTIWTRWVPIQCMWTSFHAKIGLTMFHTIPKTSVSPQVVTQINHKNSMFSNLCALKPYMTTDIGKTSDQSFILEDRCRFFKLKRRHFMDSPATSGERMFAISVPCILREQCINSLPVFLFQIVYSRRTCPSPSSGIRYYFLYTSF